MDGSAIRPSTTYAHGFPASGCWCILSASTRSCSKSDLIGSTEFIIKTIRQAEPGSKWAIGTELNLVKRLAHDHPDLEIVFLEQHVCYCATMNRIDLPHLVWALENLAQGHVVNQITVEPETERYAKAALQRMLDLPGETARD